MSRGALVLAAGAASRFGGGKLTAPWRGAPLVLWAVRAALSAPVDRVVVVLGCQADLVREALAPITDDRLAFVTAADWAQGITASLQAGLHTLPMDAGSCAVFLGDMPEIDPATVSPLFEAVEAGASAALLERAGQPAHPIVFSRVLFDALMTLRGDQGARALLRGRSDVVRLSTSDPGSTFDVDRPEDLQTVKVLK